MPVAEGAGMRKTKLNLSRNTLHVLDTETALSQVAGGGRRRTIIVVGETARHGEDDHGIDRR
jgi:hypothetical protein